MLVAIWQESEQKAKCYDFLVAFCQVHFKDVDGIKHECTVQADSLFEAVALAANEFRKHGWCGSPPGPGCDFTVRVLPVGSLQTHTIPLHQVVEFARHGVAANGAQGVMKKARLRELLGITD